MTRDQRTTRAVLKGLSGAAGATLAALIFSLLAKHFGSDFTQGLSVGGFTGLVLALLVMFLRIYRTMDEYGQRLHQRAGSLAFLITMAATALAFPLQIALHFTCPLWAVYTFGMVTWGLCVAFLAARDSRGA